MSDRMLVRHAVGWIHRDQVAQADAAIARLGATMDTTGRPVVAAASKRAERWAAVEATWREPEKWSRWGRVRRFLWAALGGRLPFWSPMVRLRIASCYGGCPSLLRTDHGDFCGDCGCGQRKIARLDGPRGKLTYRRLACPRAMPGFVNHQPVTIKET